MLATSKNFPEISKKCPSNFQVSLQYAKRFLRWPKSFLCNTKSFLRVFTFSSKKRKVSRACLSQKVSFGWHPSKTPLYFILDEEARKNFWVVFQIFPKTNDFFKNWKKSLEKNNVFFLQKKLFHRKCLKNFYIGSRDNLDKILNSFRDIPKNHDFFSQKMGKNRWKKLC